MAERHWLEALAHCRTRPLPAYDQALALGNASTPDSVRDNRMGQLERALLTRVRMSGPIINEHRVDCASRGLGATKRLHVCARLYIFILDVNKVDYV